FDLNQMQQQSRAALRKLSLMQLSDGSFPWFRGMPGSTCITRHILAGMGQLRDLDALADKNRGFGDHTEMIRQALRYADETFIESYQDLLVRESKAQDNGNRENSTGKAGTSKDRTERPDMDTDHLNTSVIHFLYMRSF